MVAIVRDEQGELLLQFVSPAQPEVIAYLRIIETGTYQLVEEYACRQRLAIAEVAAK